MSDIPTVDSILQVALQGYGDMKYRNFETQATVQRCKEINQKVLEPPLATACHPVRRFCPMQAMHARTMLLILWCNTLHGTVHARVWLLHMWRLVLCTRCFGLAF